MTLILKTKSTAYGSVGNIHGNTGPQDYVAMLDFARGEYFTRAGGVRTDYGLDDVLSVSRDGVANYQDRYGTWQQAPMNAPRFRYAETYDAYGLFVGWARTNRAASAENGSTVSITAASNTGVILSWEGSGDVSLSSPNLTLAETFTTRGRKVKRYTRSVNTAFTDALSVTGSVAHVQVETANTGEVMAPSERLAYGETTGIDRVTLRTPLLSLIGQNGTLILRTVDPDGQRAVTSAPVDLIALKTGHGQGGLYMRHRHGVGTTTPNTLLRIENGGAVNSGTDLVSWNVTGRPSGIVHGIAWEDQGQKATGMSGGMFFTTTGGAALGPFTQAKIGHDADAATTTRPLGGIITHCVLYDRHLTYDELSLMATMWQN